VTEVDRHEHVAELEVRDVRPAHSPKQDRNAAAAQDALGDRPDDAGAEARAAVRAHGDQVGVELVRVRIDGGGHILDRPAVDVALPFDASLPKLFSLPLEIFERFLLGAEMGLAVHRGGWFPFQHVQQ
jgi:hypothetical protein